MCQNTQHRLSACVHAGHPLFKLFTETLLVSVRGIKAEAWGGQLTPRALLQTALTMHDKQADGLCVSKILIQMHRPGLLASIPSPSFLVHPSGCSRLRATFAD